MPALGSALGIPFSRKVGEPPLFKYDAPGAIIGTFSRGSYATFRGPSGIMGYMPNDTARTTHIQFDPSVANFRSGTILEAQSSNGMGRSDDLRSSSNGGTWSEIGVCNSSGDLAPDNTTCFAIQNTGGTYNEGIYKSCAYTITPSVGNQSLSVFFKYVDCQLAFIRWLDGSYAVFDVLNGTLAGASSGTSYMEQWNNGWWRCSVSGPTPAVVNANMFFGPYFGSAGQYIDVFGPQCEESIVPTSYIPNSIDGVVTRAVDNWAIVPPNPQVMTVYIQGIDLTNGFLNERIVQFGSGPEMWLMPNSGGPYTYFVNASVASTSNGPLVGFGNRYDTRWTVNAAGASQVGTAINGGSESVGLLGPNVGVPVAWSTPALGGINGPSLAGQHVICKIRVFKGIKSLAYCQAH